MAQLEVNMKSTFDYRRFKDTPIFINSICFDCLEFIWFRLGVCYTFYLLSLI